MWRPTLFIRERGVKLFQNRCFQFNGRFYVWVTFSVFTGILNDRFMTNQNERTISVIL